MYMGKNRGVRKYIFCSLLINLMNTVIPYYSIKMSINLHMFSILVSVRFLSKYVLLKAIQKKLSDNFGTLLEVVA